LIFIGNFAVLAVWGCIERAPHTGVPEIVARSM
jgi:hypothetical protein